MIQNKLKQIVPVKVKKILRIIHNPHRSNFNNLKDLKTALSFLFNSGYCVQISLNERWKIIKHIHTISKSKSIDCPHNQHQMLDIMQSILSTKKDIEGCVVEAGCYKGGSSSKLSLAANIANRKLVIFDSFEGIPENSETHDQNIIYSVVAHFFIKVTGVGS